MITPDTRFRVPYDLHQDFDNAPSRTISDAHYHEVEDWSAREILAHSSNVGTITIAEQKLGETRLQQVDRHARLRQAHRRRSARRGCRASRCDNDKWYGTAILNVPIGESIAVTPLQMAALYGSIANGGTWIQPHVTAAIGGKPTTGWKHRQLVSKHVAKELRGMLTEVVDVRHRHAGAHQGLQRGRQDRHDAEVRRQARHLLRPVQAQCEYQTSFVGFAPAKNPRFVALVMVDEPHDKNGETASLEGGSVAAPTFQRIAQGILQELRVPPDRPRELAASSN